MRIEEIYNELITQCDLAKKSVALVNTAEYLASEDNQIIQNLVVCHAFLSVFTAWEHFLENSMIAYTLKASSVSGNIVHCYISPNDIDHANDLICGISKYPDWSKIEVVTKLSITLFGEENLFKKALDGFSSRYKDMQKVRNFIVHNSLKSNRQFDTLVRTALNASRVGISPSGFLLSSKNQNPIFFVLYVTHICNAAQIIADVSIPDADTPVSE